MAPAPAPAPAPVPATGTPASAPGPGSTTVRRSQKERAQDDLVMSTNSSSIVSKRSVERIYYPQEPHFFRFFVKKYQRRSPLINRGYHIRLHVIDVAVREFLARPSEKRKVVVNLGCGSDVLPWQCLTRYPKECQGAKFIDIDFPDLMAKKRAIVEANPELQAGLTGLCRSEQSDLFLQSEEYVQIGCDLRELVRIQEALAQVVDLAASEFIFVAEVSITYMETKGADAVIEWAAGLGQAEFCLLEQVLPDGPDHPFAETMLRHFDKLNTPLRSVHVYPDLDAQRSRFLRLGWPDVHVESLWDAWSSARYLSSEQRKRLNAVEPFDEWEEFAIFGSHYCVVSARTGLPVSADCAALSAPESEGGVPTLAVETAFAESAKSCQRRFGACLTMETPLGEQLMANTLGLGSTSRLRSLDLHAPGPAPVDFRLPSAGPPGRMCHTIVPLGIFGHLLVGGRTSPSTPLRDCWLFDRTRRFWNRVADLPVPLYRHSATRLGSSGLALVMGGKTGAAVFGGCLLYHPETGWAECEISGADYRPVFGAILIAHSGGPVSDQGGFYSQGILAGGLYEDGTVAEQRLRWELRTSLSSRPSLRFATFDHAANDSGATRLTTISRPSSVMDRFGAVVAYDPDGQPLVIGGVGKGGLLPRDQEILRVGLAGAEEPRVESGSVARGNSNTAEKIPQPLLLGVSTGVTTSGDVVIMGGGATCFSMGTYWNKGVYSCRIGSAQAPDPAWGFDRALELTDVPSIQLTKDAQAPSPAIIEIPRIRLDATNPFSKVLQASKPIIIQESHLGGCVNTWTPEHLVERVGAGRHVVVHEAPTSRMDFNAKNFRYVTKEFADFVREAEQGGNVYLRALSEDGPTEKAAHLSRDFPALAQEFCLPEELSLVRENTFSSVLRVSGRANMWLHYDVMANVYCQITGSKRLLLFPPSDVMALSLAPGASSSSVDVLARADGPSLASTHPHEAVLKPGEILFLPPLWLHAAEPRTDFGVAVNVFFRDLDGGYAAGRDVYGNRDLAAYEKGRQDVARIVKGFDNVPRDMREFYVARLADEMMKRLRDQDS